MGTLHTTSAQRRWWVTWVVIPGGFALATLLIGALWLSREDTVVTESIPRESSRPSRAAAPPAAPETSEADVAALAQLAGPAEHRELGDTPDDADPPDRPVDATDVARERVPSRGPPSVTPEPRATVARASVRDSSGERAPLAVPANLPRTIERPSVDPRPSATPAVVAPGGSPQAAIATLSKCPTMQDCIRLVSAPLARYGNTARFTDPGVAKVDNFDETRSAYRRALNEVRGAAKGLVEAPGGAAHEDALRGLFQALPQPAAFELAEHEIPILRRAMEKVVSRWLADRRIAIGSTLAMRVEVLTAGGDQPFAIAFEHGPSTIAGLTDLKAFLRQELADARELKAFGRQRHASIKLVLNPGGSFGLD